MKPPPTSPAEIIREHRAALYGALGLAEGIHDLGQHYKIAKAALPVPGHPERIDDDATIRRRERNREEFLRQAGAWGAPKDEPPTEPDPPKGE